MYKIVIVDDEYLTCLGLVKTVDWRSANAEVVATATDGRSGLKLIREYNPDLVLTDIRMPFLSGVDLVTVLRNEGFQGQIIVISAYKDFDYAVKTYKAGIFDYILKPVDNDELLKTVKKALAQLEKRKKAAETASENEDDAVLHLLRGERVETTANTLNSLPDSGYLLSVSQEENADWSLSEISNLLSSMFNEDGISFKSLIEDGRCYFLFSTDDLTNIRSICSRAVERLENNQLSVFTFALSPFADKDLNASRKENEELIYNKSLLGITTLEVQLPLSYKHKIAIRNFYKIISAEYNEDLTVNYVSEKMQVSQSFLMHLLKNALDKTFNDILTEYRISLAKRFLKTGKYRVNEVSQMVGYQDEKYFSRVFKKYVFKNPSEYPG